MAIENLSDIVHVLEGAHRQGAEQDEPEGARYVVLSDTLVDEMLVVLKRFTSMYDTPLGKLAETLRAYELNHGCRLYIDANNTGVMVETGKVG